MFDVVITRRADADIQNAVDWWKEYRDADQAERWYVGILIAIESLSLMPQRCLVVRNTDRLGRKVHQLLYGVSKRMTHRIFFGIDGDTVTVYRVLHTSQAAIEDASDLL